MPITSVKIKGVSCFTQEFCGFESFKTINVIIGRNNTGKSQLLKLVESICSPDRKKNRLNASYHFKGTYDENSLIGVFHRNTSNGALRGRHWEDHGQHFVDQEVAWIENEHFTVSDIETQGKDLKDHYNQTYKYEMSDAAKGALERATNNIPSPYTGKIFRHIYADRDIKTEAAEGELKLHFDGRGATNIIRDHLIRADNIMVTRRTIQTSLRGALNGIFGPDGTFTNISVQQHASGEWEIFFEEENKGLIPLSSSGSGLKTVILVLLNLLVVPELERRDPEDFVFAFEELENNLHPALLRRLLKYIEEFAIQHSCHVFLTTHSSAALDQFSRAEHAQFVRVSHNGEYATTQTISAHFDHSQVVGDLGARASDILQANGIIWVEGPSDAIYLNHWIDVFSKGRVLEGRDYACAFYGGSLLARTSFDDPTRPNPELIKLIQLNRNAALVCDSDKNSRSTPLKPRVTKAKEEMSKIPNGMIWITAGKEIETYLSGTVISASLGVTKVRDPEQFERFFPTTGKNAADDSFVQTQLGRSTIDKVDLALSAREHMTIESMKDRFDWEAKMTELISTIEKWNA